MTFRTKQAWRRRSGSLKLDYIKQTRFQLAEEIKTVVFRFNIYKLK